MNIRFFSSVVAVALVTALPGVASAQNTAPSTEVGRVAGQVPTRDQPGGDGVAANGRCGGESFGTGARRCGDQTGGPAGGISTRN